MQNRGWILWGAILVALAAAAVVLAPKSCGSGEGGGDEPVTLATAERDRTPPPERTTPAPSRATDLRSVPDEALEMELERRLAEAVADGEPGDEGEPGGEGEDADEEDADGVAGGEEPVLWPVDKDGINGVIRESLGDIRECYDQWLQANPDLSGKIVVQFTIGGDEEMARVTDIGIAESEVGHLLMEGCLMNVMEEFTFEPVADGGEVEVNYPFVFRSE